MPEKLAGASAAGVAASVGGKDVCSSVAVGAGGVRVMVGVTLGGGGIGVSVAGGVTRRSSCCPGRMIEPDVSPFQAIRSVKLTSYSSAIQARYWPLVTS